LPFFLGDTARRFAGERGELGKVHISLILEAERHNPMLTTASKLSNMDQVCLEKGKINKDLLLVDQRNFSAGTHGFTRFHAVLYPSRTPLALFSDEISRW